MAFANQKSQSLKRYDLSKKGSIDEAIIELVGFLNRLPQYFTTSSCSGRILIFENSSQKVEKKGCKWLYVSHSFVTLEDCLTNLSAIEDEAVFKFEPFVMHIQCRTLEDAQKLHQAAVASGFRNSGITIGNKGKIMMAVRSTHSLEAPLSSKGNLLVSQQYIQYLTECANRKMEENFNRIIRFQDLLQPFSSDKPSKDRKMEKKYNVKKLNAVENETCLAKETLDDGDNSDLSLFVFELT
ncbi:tRNA methyltransferase tyw3 [Bulinus truncatus]|nr:tRNA methyltransferase tyw3 [Bulinus truncatus]